MQSVHRSDSGDRIGTVAEVHGPVAVIDRERPPPLIAVGYRLHIAMEGDPRAAASTNGAVKRLEDVSAQLKRRSNVLRQEATIERIEVIPLSSAEPPVS